LANRIVEDREVSRWQTPFAALHQCDRTYENSQIRMVDLMKMNLDAKDIVTISIRGDEVIKPLIP
jgi:hypothetical protein